jgi:glucokinase-like ROK family protein
MKKATQQQTKEHNRNLVLKTIFEHAEISRAEIARITKLTRTTVSDIVADLIAEGLVAEIGIGSSIGGKSPILLSLVEDSRCVIGLNLAQDQFRGAVVNLRGRIREMVSLPVDDRNGNEALSLVYDILDRLLLSACQPVVGIGVGTPGLVNTREGIVVNAVNLDWKNLPLADLLKDRYYLPVYVLNDSQAAAMGEFTYGGNYQSDDHLIVINIRHGIGAGIIINGRLFQGDGGGAGEIGHIVVVPEGGLPCRCGKRGCLETVASAQAVLKQIRALSNGLRMPLTIPSQQTSALEAIKEAFAAGDPRVRRVVLEAARYLGLGISSLVGTLNIRKIILTGDMTRFGEPWLNAVRESAAQFSLAGLAADTRIEIGQLAEYGIIQGASAMLASNYSLLLFQPSRLSG